MTAGPDMLLNAIAFAARQHRHQLRKDGVTPYFSHCARVLAITSAVFGISDEKVLATAVLHDTIEDTTADMDDLLEQFGKDVGHWVGALTKDMRLPEHERETTYKGVLANAPWQVAVCKLADIYDNLTDVVTLPPANITRTLQRSEAYLACLKPSITPESYTAFSKVELKLEQVKRQVAKSI